MQKNQQTLPKIIIDTDAGHDDMLALMLLVKSKKFEILAITTVAGNSTLENVTRNTSAILDLLNERSIPVYSGKDRPLARELVTAVVHGESGLDGLDMSKTQYTLTGDADQKITELVTQYPGEVSILTLGPVTNVARAFQNQPSLANQVKQLVIMGGAITVPGNKNRVAEFNFFVDPEAANIVLQTSVNKVLVPLDPCNDIVLSLDTFEPLKGTSLYTPLTTLMKHFIAGIKTEEGVDGALVYDALAAYYLLRPDAFIQEPMDILIETQGEHTFGMTVAERRQNKPVTPNAQVVVNINQEQFIQDLVMFLAK